MVQFGEGTETQDLKVGGGQETFELGGEEITDLVSLVAGRGRFALARARDREVYRDEMIDFVEHGRGRSLDHLITLDNFFHPGGGSLGKNGRAVPEIADEETSRSEVAPDVAQQREDTVVGGLIRNDSEQAEHEVELGIERGGLSAALAELEMTRSWGQEGLFAAGVVEHFVGAIEAAYVVAANGER